MPSASSRIPIHRLALSKFRLGYMDRYRIPAFLLSSYDPLFTIALQIPGLLYHSFH